MNMQNVSPEFHKHNILIVGLKILAAIAVSKFLIMLIFSLMHIEIEKWMSPLLIALTDVLILSIVASVVIFYWVVNPKTLQERKLVEDVLMKNGELYRTLAEAAHDAMFVIDREYHVRYANSFAAKQGGLRQDEMIGKPLKTLFPPDIYNQQKLNLQKVFETGKQLYAEEMMPFSGTELWLSTLLVPIRNGEDKISSILGISRDITEHKRTEKDLQQTTETLQALIQASPLAINAVNADGSVKIWNSAAERIFGWSEHEAIGRFNPIVPEEKKNDFLAIIKRALNGESFIGREVRRQKKDGSPIDVSLSIAPIRDFKGNMAGVMGVIEDITERKKAEETIKLLSRQNELILKSAGEGIYGLDHNGKTTFINPAAAGMIGWEVEEIIGRRLHNILHHSRPDGSPYPAEDCPIYAAFKDGTVHNITDEVFWRKDGTSFPVEYTSTPILEDGKIVGAVVVFRDITERKNAEQRLRNSESRLRVAQHIAHLGHWELDLVKNALYWSDEVYRMFGLEPQEFGATYEAFLEHVHPDDRDFVNRAYTESVKNKTGYDIEHRILLKNGEMKYVNERCATEYDEKGNPLRSLGTVLDITERKKMEEEILLTKHDWEDTFNTITDMITVHDKDFNIIRANKAAEKILGLPLLEKTADAKCFRYYHGTEKPPEGCPSCSCLETGIPCTFELFEPNLNMFIEIRAIPRLDSNNNLVGLIHVVRDITERKKTEERIQRHLQKLSSLRSIDLAISSSLDIRLTLNVFIDHVVTQLGIDAAAVLLLNPRSRMLEYSAGQGFRTNALKHSRLRLGQGYAGVAALENRIVSVPNLNEEGTGFKRLGILEGEDFITYYGVPLVAKGHVKGVLEIFHRSPLEPDEEWFEFLDGLALQAAIAIDNNSLFYDLQRSNMDLTLAYDSTIEGWSRALDYRDKETEGHSQRVTDLTIRIAREMGLSEEELVHVRRGALLHDIGKMRIPDSILFKPGTLTDEEWKVMRQHPVYAYELLSPIAYLKPALNIPYCHHERLDGSGYPRGLRSEQIPLCARIFAVVDVWDALCSDRPYRPAWSDEKAKEYITSFSGIQFDPAVVEIFIGAIAEKKD